MGGAGKKKLVRKEWNYQRILKDLILRLAEVQQELKIHHLPIILSVRNCAIWNSSLPDYHIQTWVKTHMAQLHSTARHKDGLVLLLPLPTSTHIFVFKKIVTLKHFEKVTDCLIVKSYLRSTLCANRYIWLRTGKVSTSKEVHSFPLFPWEIKWNWGVLFSLFIS